MKKILIYVFITSIILGSCEQNVDFMINSEPVKEAEVEGVEKEIMLWGSKAWVLDCGDYYLFQGDIKLNKKDVEEMNADTLLRSAMVSNRKWTNSNVYYTLNTNLTSQLRERITDAMSHIEQNTYIRFMVKGNNTSDYIEFIRDDSDPGIAGYSDWIGKKGGRQVIGLSETASRGNVIHEIGHALGLFHEHTRSDRDNFIIVNFNVIPSNRQSNYRKYTETGYSGTDYGVFDFNSIMLYSSIMYEGYSTFAMVRKSDGNAFTGQRNGLSPGDISVLLSVYNDPIVTISGPVDVPAGMFNPNTAYTYYANIRGSYNGNYQWSLQRLGGPYLNLPGNEGSQILYLVQDPVGSGSDKEYILSVYTNLGGVGGREASMNIKVEGKYLFTHIKGQFPID